MPGATATGASPGDYVLTLEQMVIQGVLPAELATAAARSFGWDGSHLISEGAFLELFVPVAPEETTLKNRERMQRVKNNGKDVGIQLTGLSHLSFLAAAVYPGSKKRMGHGGTLFMTI